MDYNEDRSQVRTASGPRIMARFAPTRWNSSEGRSIAFGVVATSGTASCARIRLMMTQHISQFG